LETEEKYVHVGLEIEETGKGENGEWVNSVAMVRYVGLEMKAIRNDWKLKK
jgi:hypothetical protein